MKLRRKENLFTLFIIFLMATSIPINKVSSADDEIAKPELLKVSLNDEELTDLQVPQYSVVTIEYSADRITTDGLILLGEGSNLTMSIDQAQLNYSFTFDRALKDKKYYNLELNVTENTKFIAYAWQDNITNGIYEEINSLDAVGGYDAHQIFVNEDMQTPKLLKVVNATDMGEDGFITSNTSLLTVRYRVVSPQNRSVDRYLSIVFSDNSTNLLNDNSRQTYNMSWVGFDDNIHTFEYKFILNTSRTIFFTAYNKAGIERDVTGISLTHRISLQFLFNSTYTAFAGNKFTDLDIISFNVTSFNQTTDDTFYLRYKTANSSDNIENENYTKVMLKLKEGPLIRNSTLNNSTETVYSFSFNETFSANEVVEIQAYVTYLNFTEYLPLKRLTIVDSRPDTGFLNKNSTVTNAEEFTTYFYAKTAKGSLTNVTLYSGLNSTGTFNTTVNVKSSENIESRANYTLSFTTEGIYAIHINATNSLNRSRTSLIYVTVDFTSPVGSVSIQKFDNSTGFVILSFSYSDTLSNYSYVEINWGDGLYENVTFLNSISHQYSKTGNYKANMTIIDNAGNIKVYSLTIVVNLPLSQTTNNNNSPFFFTPIVLSIAALVVIRRFVNTKAEPNY